MKMLPEWAIPCGVEQTFDIHDLEDAYDRASRAEKTLKIVSDREQTIHSVNIALTHEVVRLREAIAAISYCSAQCGEDAMKMRNIAMDISREWTNGIKELHVKIN